MNWAAHSRHWYTPAHKFCAFVSLCMLLMSFCQVRAQVPESPRIRRFLRNIDSLARLGNHNEVHRKLDSTLLTLTNNSSLINKNRILLKKAVLYQIRSEYGRALLLLFDYRSELERNKDSLSLAEVLIYIGAIYHNMGDLAKAAEYYHISLDIYEKLNLWSELIICYNNLGALAEDQNQPLKAIKYHRKAMALWKAYHDTVWRSLTYLHIGLCYNKLGNYDSAFYYLNSSEKYVKAAKNEMLLTIVNNYLGNTYYKIGNLNQAKLYCEKGLALAHELDVTRFQSECHECLYKVYEAKGKHRNALYHHKMFLKLRDSLYNEKKTKDITSMEMEYGFKQKMYADSIKGALLKKQNDLEFEKRLMHEREQRNFSIYAGVLILIFSTGLWSRLVVIRRSRRALAAEKERTEQLLLKVLPAEIVDELKTSGTTEGREHDNISVLFLDIKNFTGVAQKMTPKQLVEELNTIFKKFDLIVESYNIEKIKTVGDSYMAAAGVPTSMADGATKIVSAALDIQKYLNERKNELCAEGKPAFEMRAGIHTGPVIAGVVGVNKFQYDIWGDTVNTASRMESNGEAGKVNISKVTFEIIKDNPAFEFEFRGVINVKGKGLMEMYFVEFKQHNNTAKEQLVQATHL